MALMTALLLTTHLLTPPLALVDFRLAPFETPREQAVITSQPAPDPPTAVGEHQAVTMSATRQAVRPSPSFAVARGFGRNVPLSFAARQIVPPSVRIRYASGVRLDALVSWTGERPWNRALQDAIRPLHLRMTLLQDTVTISQ